MLNRKINPESFDQFLHAYRPPTDMPREPHSTFSPQGNQTWVEPETGEILNSPTSQIKKQSFSFTQEHSAPENFDPMIKNIPNPISIDKTYLPYLPCLITLALQLLVSWFTYQQSQLIELSINQSLQANELVTKELASQKTQLSQFLEEVIALNESLESEILDISKSKVTEVNSTEKPIAKSTPPKKTRPGSTISPAIKYLGAATRDENHQVLIESPTGIHFFRIGDIVFKGWRLSAIESQKLLLTNIDGHQQIIPLTKVYP